MTDIYPDYEFAILKSARLQIVQTSSCNLKIREILLDTEDF